MKSIISSHNQHVLSNANAPTLQPDTCNCRKKSDCPLEGKCLQTNVIYQATVTTETATETYVGLATNFKERYRNHKTSFWHLKRKNETELSKYVWNLQNENKPFQIKWKILKKCTYSNINKSKAPRSKLMDELNWCRKHSSTIKEKHKNLFERFIVYGLAKIQHDLKYRIACAPEYSRNLLSVQHFYLQSKDHF